MQTKFDFETYAMFKNKQLFNCTFKEYLNRDWLFLDSIDQKESLYELLEKHKCLIIKPISGHCGQGVQCIKKEEVQRINHLIDDIKTGGQYLCEEKIENIKSLKQLNPTSLNTIRVNTFVDKEGNVHFLDFVLRVGGAGSIIDNLNGGGVAYHVNSIHGIVDQPGKNSNNEYFYYHPSTGIKMIGFEIPNFLELKDFLTKIAKVCPLARIVGWDVAITEKGFVLIEGNMGSGEDAMQLDGLGYYNFIKKTGNYENSNYWGIPRSIISLQES